MPEPQRLVQLTHGMGGDRGPSLSYPPFESLRKRNAAGVDLFGFSYAHVQFVSGPIQRTGESVQLVSGNFYDALNIRPELGRLLSPSNDKAAGDFNNVAVISDRLWRNGFHGDLGVAGKKILLDGVPFIVLASYRVDSSEWFRANTPTLRSHLRVYPCSFPGKRCSLAVNAIQC